MKTPSRPRHIVTSTTLYEPRYEFTPRKLHSVVTTDGRIGAVCATRFWRSIVQFGPDGPFEVHLNSTLRSVWAAPPRAHQLKLQDDVASTFYNADTREALGL